VLTLPAQIQQQVGQYYVDTQQPNTYGGSPAGGVPVNNNTTNNTPIYITVNGAQVPQNVATAIASELAARGVLLPPRS
jgi:hypothetical protein